MNENIVLAYIYNGWELCGIIGIMPPFNYLVYSSYFDVNFTVPFYLVKIAQ